MIKSACAEVKRGEEEREGGASKKERGGEVKKLDGVFNRGAEL
jgi:hypothetical protein